MTHLPDLLNDRPYLWLDEYVGFGILYQYICLFKYVTVVFDNTKLKRAVPDMRTNVRFDMGVRYALDYVLAHPDECQKEDPEFDAWCDKVIEVIEQAKEQF